MRLGRACAALAVVLTVLLIVPAAGSQLPNEVRALWVVERSLNSASSVIAVVSAARKYGFNTLLVEVPGHSETNGIVDQRLGVIGLQPQASHFDPLKALITSAHAAGLRVHAWVNVNLVADANNLPSSRDHIVYRHPEWLMIPRSLSKELAKLEPENPAYLGTLARWTRKHSDTVDGLFLSPLTNEAASYSAKMLTNLVRHYQLDGVHLDSLYYPDETFDYSRTAMMELRENVKTSSVEAKRLSVDIAEPLYADHYPERWASLRRSRLTSLLMRLRTTVKKHLPEAVFSAALIPEENVALNQFQDWRTWLDSGLLDVVCPRAYTQNADLFEKQIAAVRKMATSSKVWAGIGSHRLSVRQTLANIEAARRQHADGVALFSYESLTDPTLHEMDYLERIAEEAFLISALTPGPL
ncbi:uncharacterized protein METZ01_LOCUS15886 [marine metagenome]|uniref:Glycosyl hydrolase-like 10 domain-containing protein n=1 Tax=marine metagenome TaxID=408172 RepID=A0A381P7V9_9ZZZZ